MATVLTAIAPVLYSAAQEVSAEPASLVRSIYADFDNKGVAFGDTVDVPVVPAQALETFTPAAASTAGAGAGTAEKVQVSITAQNKVSHVLTGEQIRSLENGGNYEEWVRQWGAQAMRTLRNAAESDCATAIKQGASRAYGTAGTTPFASDINALADLRKILRDNGAPLSDLQFVGNSNVELALLKLGIVQQAYAAGTAQQLSSGIIDSKFGFNIRVSAGIGLHTKGTVNTCVSDLAETAAIGTTAINSDTFSSQGTVLAGDIITWAGDSNKYVIGTAIAAAANDDDIVLNRPGLRASLANGVTGTIGASYTPSFGFERSAVVGVMRPPLIPSNPTMRQMMVTDGMGMTYLFLEIDQYGQRTWEMHLCHGFKVVQPEHVAILLG